jgi:hypothetical protein
LTARWRIKKQDGELTARWRIKQQEGEFLVVTGISYVQV